MANLNPAQQALYDQNYAKTRDYVRDLVRSVVQHRKNSGCRETLCGGIIVGEVFDGRLDGARGSLDEMTRLAETYAALLYALINTHAQAILDGHLPVVD